MIGVPVVPVPTDQQAELARGERVLRALLTALNEEAARLGARLALVLVPPPRAPRFGETTPTNRLLDMAAELRQAFVLCHGMLLRLRTGVPNLKVAT